MPFVLVGVLGGWRWCLIAMFGRKQDNPAIVLSYAALEGLFLGAASFLFANLVVHRWSAGMIAQAIFGTLGVFVGMLVVYKTGAIRVTPKFTRMMVAALFGVVADRAVNFVLAMFGVGGGRASVFAAVARWRSSSRSSDRPGGVHASWPTSTRPTRRSAPAHRRRRRGGLPSA